MKSQFMFTYWNNYSKVIQIIEAVNLTLAIEIFLHRRVAANLNDAIGFKVKKVQS